MLTTGKDVHDVRLIQLALQDTGHSEEDVRLKQRMRDSLVVQWLEINSSTAEDMSSVPRQETKIPRDMWHSQEI